MAGHARQAVLIFPPGTDVLPLVAESLALLPAELRWRVTFSTYFTKLPPGIACQWRCVIEGTPEAAAAQQGPPGTLLIDLCCPRRAATGASASRRRARAACAHGSDPRFCFPNRRPGPPAAARRRPC